MTPKPVQKHDRRVHADRRAHTRGGRRNIDGSLREQCPACASTDIECTPAKHGVFEFRCHACQETWVGISGHRSV
jgi:ribosome modulation factor